MSNTAESETQPATTRTTGATRRTWLVLIHQIPAEPAYLRVKVSRRLRAIGAVPLKNSVYVLPDGDETREDFHWLRREIVDGGGDATMSTVRFLEGAEDDEVMAMFDADRRAEYLEVVEAASALDDEASSRGGIERLRRRMAEIQARDHFGSPWRARAEKALEEAGARERGESTAGPAARVERPEGATWVTRRGLFIDRIASAWLIRRHIDPAARFRFVSAYDDVAESELAFDMFGGGFTHEGDRCTFETLLTHFALEDAALRAIAEIIHDIDLKDGRYDRPETAGIAGLVRGIAASHSDDEGRLAAGLPLFDALYAQFAAGMP